MAAVQITSTQATARARLLSNGHQPDVRIAPGGLAPWQERTSPTAGDQRADVRERDGPLDRARVGHVTWHPFRIELLLVEAHSLEVVPVLTPPKEKPGELLAHSSAGVFANRRERR